MHKVSRASWRASPGNLFKKLLLFLLLFFFFFSGGIKLQFNHCLLRKSHRKLCSQEQQPETFNFEAASQQKGMKLLALKTPLPASLDPRYHLSQIFLGIPILSRVRSQITPRWLPKHLQRCSEHILMFRFSVFC